ncbi:SIS domain-containing protein [Blautia liquoris]|jgi:fructoselysine-6-phosphate deglycase|uniref:SIS domain-containing protein n=1 Tax=Blautia liquoris TaxID=2779518 RepID=A0A7M2REP8_9FIRM|nr:SIS domain-containing protein [Blautia liquoris]QOV18815.1 SIS domain-containing protein [Blautia liquoris]
MLKFNEDEIKKEVKEVLDLREAIEKCVTKICNDGYENIFIMGIGGTYAVAEEIMAYMKGHTKINLYIENAADLIAEGNTKLGKKSIVIISSDTGRTQEMIDAVKLCKNQASTIIGFVQDKKSPLADLCDSLFAGPGSAYLKILLIMLDFMKENNEFELYDSFYNQMEYLPKGLADVQKSVDSKAEDFAKKHGNDQMHYIIGGGSLKGAAYSYAMCYMEEMLWMRTKSVSAADFFHGTLEIIDRDSNVTLFKGEDGAREQEERVEKFLPRICENITVFDTKEYQMKGIDQKFRDLLTPLIMSAIYARINVHLEKVRRHPMEIRRYYHRLDY